MVANGEQLQCDEIYLSIPMEIQGYQFQTNVYPLDLQGSNIVLGMQWLQSLGKVLHDWEILIMEFCVKEKNFLIQGETTKGVVQESIQSMQSLVANGSDMFLMQMVSMSEQKGGTSLTNVVAHEMEQLLFHYNTIFQEPTTLPPPRVHDHHIPLEPGFRPVNVRPYRNPHIQKNEIKRAVKEMLETGIIRPSSSSFSSPILLVKKKDGSWCFCVDYRALKKVTVKDRYLIPMIGELLNELHGASYFTKLNLKSRYHQIRVQPEDIHKTAFHTYDGHYEFLVMPFELTNALAIFQSLMNDIFRPALRRYVLVFFDDILIYSKCWNDHLRHLRIVFNTLLHNQLFVNQSKCFFGQQEVYYLGHIISPKGVSANPNKIQCMKSWPTLTTITSQHGFLGLTGHY